MIVMKLITLSIQLQETFDNEQISRTLVRMGNIVKYFKLDGH